MPPKPGDEVAVISTRPDPDMDAALIQFAKTLPSMSTPSTRITPSTTAAPNVRRLAPKVPVAPMVVATPILMFATVKSLLLETEVGVERP